MKLTVVILAFNEEIHIERCINSAKLISDTIYVVDSFSTDKTRMLAEELGAQCLFREFDSHAAQFNWALSQIAHCEWVVRIDSDEYLTDELVSSIKTCVSIDSDSLNGFSFKRRIYFLGKAISFGGVFPVEIVRMFRYGFGKVEDRLMDEHILVEGEVGTLEGEIIDDNKSSLTWWINKHNRYSSLEALEMYFEEKSHLSQSKLSGATAFRRRLKTIYQNLPIHTRTSLLFVYRYIVRLGFLDGFHGFIFHFYQGYWYRLLVDTKFYLLIEANINLNSTDLSIDEISKILDIEKEIVVSMMTAKQKSAN
jgi:glycosyltransferase involved in cell wall biosynthesis